MKIDALPIRICQTAHSIVVIAFSRKTRNRNPKVNELFLVTAVLQEAIVFSQHIPFTAVRCIMKGSRKAKMSVDGLEDLDTVLSGRFQQSVDEQ